MNRPIAPLSTGVRKRLRQLPAVDEVLHWPELAAFAGLPHRLRVGVIRRTLDAGRLAIQNGGAVPSREDWLTHFATALQRAAGPSLQRVINGTGVLMRRAWARRMRFRADR